jgi:polygalacturonase
MNIFNVRDFGARGDGVALDSPSIQQAFDRAAAAGGGTVWFPPGIYLAGNLQLRDHLTVHLADGAVLKAVADPTAYPEDRTVHPTWLRHYLLEGRKVKNITIEGTGCIDGSGPAFWEDHYINDEVLAPKSWRPAVIYLIDSQDIILRDFKIIDASSFTVWPIGCENVTIDNLTIRSPRNGPNTDCLDIDCCRNVRISNCNLDAGDDCIALKSDGVRLGRMMPCENIAVTNCTLSTTTCGVRIGYEGDAPIRDCVFSNLTMHQCCHGIDLLSIRPDAKANHIVQGTPIDRISFNNIVMHDVGKAIFLWAGREKPEFDFTGHIRGVSITGLQGEVTDSSYIGGNLDYAAIENLLLRDVRLVQNGRIDGPGADGIPSHWGGGFMPWSLTLRQVRGIIMENVAFHKGEVSGAWGGALRWHGADDFRYNGAAMAADSQLA